MAVATKPRKKRKVGRPRLTGKALELASHDTKSRRRREAEAKRPALSSLTIEAPPRDPMPKTKRQWDALLRLLPGYDPYKTRGDVRFDANRARSSIDFFETKLHHVKGPLARQELRLQPWQRAVVANLFGWLIQIKIAGVRYWVRRYKECLIYVPRKNGKTPLAAGIIAYGLKEDDEPGAEIYGAAAEFQQAMFVFEWVRGYLDYCDELSEGTKIYRGQSAAITIPAEHRQYRVLSGKAPSKHGMNTHMAVLDELHTQPDGELVEALETSMAARHNPLLVYLTTADYERAGSICNLKHDYAHQVIAGLIDNPRFLPVIYEATRDDDWTAEATWRKANPNADVSIPVQVLREECQKAKDQPSYENSFKRLHLNIRTEQDVRWLPMDAWNGCKGHPARPLEGRQCWAGLDLSATSDTTALVLVFPADDGSFDLLPFFWLPSEYAQKREAKDGITYGGWIRDGHIVATDGEVVDYKVIRRTLNELRKVYKIRQLAVDMLYQGLSLAIQLRDDDGFDVVAHGQGFNAMAAPTDLFEQCVISRKIRHPGNPVLDWMAANVTVKIGDEGDKKPSKKKSSGKIDGIVAAIMALGLAEKSDKQEQKFTGFRRL
jgi:phage terminase large subunit-like protein